MRFKALLPVSVSVFFACFNAYALDWTGTEDLSAINAQIICTGTDCVLSNIAAGNITGQININGVNGLNSFVLSDENNNGNPTNISASVSDDYLLSLNGFEGNNIELNGNITNTGTGYGVRVIYSYLSDDLILSGINTIASYNAAYLTYLTIGGDFISSGTNTASDSNAIYLYSSNVSGDFISSGTNTASDSSLVLDSSNINGDFISSGTNTVSGDMAIFLTSSIVNGDFISSGINTASGNHAVFLSYSKVNGNFISSGINTANNNSIYLSYSTINGDFVSSGINNTSINAIVAENSTINGDFISSGKNTADQYAISFGYSTFNGNFINTGKTIAGTINPDDTFNATGDQALILAYSNILGGNFINTGTIAAASEGMWLEKTRIVGDIVNSGKILGGNVDFFGQETAGLYFVDSALMGKIQNTSNGIIFGGYGITMSQDYKDGTAGTYAAKNMTIENNGTITGSLYDAIAFDITSSDDIHGGTGLSYDNVLNYSGAGVLISNNISGSDYDIDMGKGTDVLNYTNVRGKWFATNGAETINVSNYIVQTTYTDDLTAMIIHTDGLTTTDFNVSKMGFLVDTAGTYTAGSDWYVMSGVDAMTDTDLANMSMQLEGYAGTDGYFFMDGTNLKYHLNSLGVIGAHSDQAVAASDVPSITATNSSIVSAQNLNRSAMNMVSGRMMKLNNNKTFDTSGLWAQGFGEQSTYEGKIVNNSANSVGYDSDRYGIAIGYDKYLGSGVLAGLAVSYGLGDVNGDTDQFTTDIKQYQLNLYGSYNIENYFVDAQVGIGTTKYDQKRAYVGSEATAKYDSKSISAGLGAGYVWQAMEKLSVTPYTRFNYIKSNQDAYTESSNLRVDAVELTSEQASFGTEVAYNLLSSMGAKFQPRVFVEYARELGDDEIAINSQYTDNMAIGTTGYSPDLGNSIIRTGAGITMMGASNDYSVGLDYRYETRERYTSNGVMLNGKLFF